MPYTFCHLSHLADPLDFSISQIYFDIFQISVVSVPVTGTGTIYIYIYINKSLLFFFYKERERERERECVSKASFFLLKNRKLYIYCMTYSPTSVTALTQIWKWKSWKWIWEFGKSRGSAMYNLYVLECSRTFESMPYTFLRQSPG